MTDYEKGLYFLKQNELNKAILCFKKSARDGNVEAMNNLASLYLQQKNYKEATLWYKQAISKGNIKAANNLAVLYEMTKTTERSFTWTTAINRKKGLLRTQHSRIPASRAARTELAAAPRVKMLLIIKRRKA